MTSLEFHITALATATDCRWPPDRPESAQAVGLLAPEVHVLDDVEVVAQREVLVDDLDAEPRGVLRPVDVHGLAGEADLARVDGMDARDALDQRRLARAVVAHEGHDLARRDVEVDLVERLNRTEGLRDPLQLEHRRVTHCFSPPRVPPGARARPGRPILS
jgi:hypothetical protein